MSLKNSTLIILLALIGKATLAQTANNSPAIYNSVPGIVLLAPDSAHILQAGRLHLPSAKGNKAFDLIQYDHYYFCVPPEKRAAFVAELNTNEALFANIKFIQAGEQTYTAEEWIATQLLVDFNGRDLTGEPR